jgi:antitoxin PrlF
MSEAVTVRMDSKGRVTVPPEAREAAGIAPGDTLLLVVRDGRLQFIPVAVAFDILADHALEEHRAGRTRDLREIAAEMDVSLP